jgi:serine protease AprX
MNGMISSPSLKRLFAWLIAIALIAALVGPAGPVFLAPPHQATASFIVQGLTTQLAADQVTAHGGKVTTRLEIIRGVAARLSAAAALQLRAAPGITAVTPNASVKASGRSRTPATDYPDVVGADLVWEQGINGSGVAVAVLDTGLALHPGLLKDINNRPKHISAWVDFVADRRFPVDPNGHGTHVAGIIANTETGNDGEWNGTAPGVKLVGVRVLNYQGFGTYEQVIHGIQWVIEHKDEFNIKVMNLSLVSLAVSPYWADPLNQAVTRAWAEGITVVAAAGNYGPDPMTVGVPGNNPYVITVGAFTDNYTPNYWDDDYIAPFSATDPTLDGFIKPDVVAPGAHMVSTMLNASYLARNHEANWVAPQYFEMAGSSQATAVVSGIAALVLSRNPLLTPDQVKYRLTHTAFPWVDVNTTEAMYSIWQQGAGRVNAPDAVFADFDGIANAGLDIWADLDGSQHYEGFSYYDEAVGEFRLRGDFADWGGSYWDWDGLYEARSGGFGSWSGGFGSWSGGFGSWSGGFGSWSGGFGSWSGGFGSWSGGFGSWSGGFGSWSGGFGSWSGNEPWAGSYVAEQAFVVNFLAGASPDEDSTTTSIGLWVSEP